MDPGHARQRCVLTALLVDANNVVRTDELLERVWGGRGPQRARDGLYTYLSRLRRLLAGSAEVRLERRSGGYLLAVDPAAIDLYRFRDLVARAGAADDDEKALRLFDEALELWRGEPFAHLDTPWLDLQRQGLHRERVAAQRDRADAALRLGRHGAILPELCRQSIEYPLDERLVGQLMLVLYRSGQQAEALERYRQLSGELSEALGIEPQPELRELYRRILNADPSVAASPQPGLAGPRQLPAPPTQFVGRVGELARLGRVALPPAGVDGQGSVVTISGPGGIGKSWLALRWAGDSLAEFPDGQLYVNLLGFDPVAEPMPAATALRGFLDAFGVPPASMPAEADALAGRYRSLVAGRRMLIMLDNARDTAQVVPLLPGVGTCTVLVTSRRNLTGLVTAHGAVPLRLGLLADEEAASLLAGVMGRRRVAAEPDSVSGILAQCGGLPLALGVVAAHAVTHPHLPLAALAQQLRDDATRLDSLHADDLTASLRAVFAASCRALTPAADRAFALLGVPAGPDLSAPAIASLTDLSPATCRVVLGELTDAHLVEQHSPDRYRLHDLIRLYAAERAQHEHPPADRHAALRRLLEHYTRLAEAADRTRDPDGSAEPGDFQHRDQAVAWFRAEHGVLIALCRQAADAGFDAHLCRLAFALRYHLEDGGHWDELTTVQSAAVTAARRLSDRAAEGNACYSLARAHARLRRYDDADALYRQAIAIFAALGDAVGEAHARRGLGGLCERRGRRADAVAHNQRALDLYRQAGDKVGQAMALNNAAWVCAHSGDHQQALDHCQEALDLLGQDSHRHPEAAAWDTLGFVHHRRGEYRRATACYRRAVALCRELGDRYSEADALRGLAEACQADGDHAAARDAWRRALEILEQLRHPEADRVRAALTQLP
ncbi:SARP family transcriptional regulator [Micromonospora deserti]|uniref:SARP family transcriptional regulator n=1 Tax=Micromonospora deserti TaxID=2070366 RepID=A0A2W2DAY9_9ACTN|nr:SARP family transcriptional regulator [Micromonospora deserti]